MVSQGTKLAIAAARPCAINANFKDYSWAAIRWGHKALSTVQVADQRLARTRKVVSNAKC